MKPCTIVNLATQHSWYPRGQARLLESINRVLAPVTPKYAVYTYKSEAEVGAPLHTDVQYAFKPYAIEAARVASGNDIILWQDAANWIVTDIAPMVEVIESQGSLFFYNGICDRWCSDVCLDYFKVTRDHAAKIPMIQANCMGFDVSNPVVRDLQQEYFRLAKEHPEIFKGDWNNDHQQVSSDPRCAGHRHDQSVVSLLIWQRQLPITVQMPKDEPSTIEANLVKVDYLQFQYCLYGAPNNGLILTQGM